MRFELIVIDIRSRASPRGLRFGKTPDGRPTEMVEGRKGGKWHFEIEQKEPREPLQEYRVEKVAVLRAQRNIRASSSRYNVDVLEDETYGREAKVPCR
ncbi:hypothetical protein KM043_008104 [Ampulex compressa]|nr:hypothetical protein KM043_008104 [Ampulex compressa]